MSNVELSLQERRKIFIEHLESDKYKQTQKQLRDDNGYCCLGVACVVYDVLNEHSPEENWVGSSHKFSLSEIPSGDVLQFFELNVYDIDLGKEFYEAMWQWNDNEKLTFTEIAAKLRTLWNIPKEQ
jgi:hypothetical protein